MSKVSIQGDVSGTGDFTIKAPNSNVDRTLTLPDEAGTVATVENLPAGYTDSDALDLFNATGSAPVYACRAWVNFDGTGTVSIRGSGNVSSITDRGTATYTVNFATNLIDTTYTVAMATLSANTSNLTAANALIEGSGTSGYNAPNIRTTSALGLVHARNTGEKEDSEEMYVSIFR